MMGYSKVVSMMVDGLHTNYDGLHEAQADLVNQGRGHIQNYVIRL